MIRAAVKRGQQLFGRARLSTANKHFDLVTIGGGSGGLFCALKASQYNKNVCVIDKHKLGGRCVHAGCVPKKIIYNATMIREDMEHGLDYGVTYDNPRIDWLKIKKARDDHTHAMHLEYIKDCKAAGVNFMHGEARFLGPHTLEVRDPETRARREVTADHIVVATGSRPLMPSCIEGIEECLNTDSFFALTSLPKDIVIIGCGYIGIEVACSLRAFGIRASVCTFDSCIVSPLDTEVTDMLKKYMEDNGTAIYYGARVRSIRSQAGRKVVTFEDGRSVSAEAVLCAAGIAPNTRGLGLEQLGVKMDVRDNVVVDDYENSSVPGIYAIGDATGKVILTPVAKTAGERLATRLFGGKPDSKLDYSTIPTVVFSHPPMGKVGLTEKEAIGRFGRENVRVYKAVRKMLFYEVTQHKSPAFFKLVCSLPDERVVGIHAIGRGVDEMIQGYAVALTAHATKKDYENTLAIHPTESEAFVAL